jgi:hypothetical protein
MCEWLFFLGIWWEEESTQIITYFAYVIEFIA